MINIRLYKKFCYLDKMSTQISRSISSYTYLFSYDSVSVKNVGTVNPPHVEKIEFLVADKEVGDLNAFAVNSNQFNQLITSLCVFLVSSNLCYSTFVLSTSKPSHDTESTFKQIESMYSIQQTAVLSKYKEIDRFLKLLSRVIEISGPLERVLYYQDDFVKTLTIPMTSFNKSGFIKFESVKDFEGLHIFARIHFNRASTAVIKNPLSLFESVNYS